MISFYFKISGNYEIVIITLETDKCNMTTLNKKLLMTSDTFANLPVNDAVSIASVANVDQKKQSSQTVAPTIIIHQSPLPPLPPSTCRKILHLHAAALVAENGSVSDFLEPLQSSHSNNDEHPNPDQDRDQNLSPVPEIVEHPDYITIEHNINSDNEDEDSLDHKEHFILQGSYFYSLFFTILPINSNHRKLLKFENSNYRKLLKFDNSNQGKVLKFENSNQGKVLKFENSNNTQTHRI